MKKLLFVPLLLFFILFSNLASSQTSFIYFSKQKKADNTVLKFVGYFDKYYLSIVNGGKILDHQLKLETTFFNMGISVNTYSILINGKSGTMKIRHTIGDNLGKPINEIGFYYKGLNQREHPETFFLYTPR